MRITTLSPEPVEEQSLSSNILFWVVQLYSLNQVHSCIDKTKSDGTRKIILGRSYNEPYLIISHCTGKPFIIQTCLTNLGVSLKCIWSFCHSCFWINLTFQSSYSKKIIHTAKVDGHVVCRIFMQETRNSFNIQITSLILRECSDAVLPLLSAQSRGKEREPDQQK